ncbi:MAG: hypothetical protein ACXWG1_05385 [Usitatibacter sp.]
MKVRLFTLRGTIWSWNLDMAPLEREINEWFAANPDIDVYKIHHELSVTMFTSPVAYAWIYYR